MSMLGVGFLAGVLNAGAGPGTVTLIGIEVQRFSLWSIYRILAAGRNDPSHRIAVHSGR